MTQIKQDSGCAAVFILVWLGFWTLFTLCMDGFLGWSAWRQLRASGYAKAPGFITESRLVASAGDEGGTTYGVELKYTYRLADQQLSGNRIRYVDGFGSRTGAERRMTTYRVGNEVKVYYNPRDTSDSLLEPGLAGNDFFLALFMTPFNVIMIGGWAFWRRMDLFGNVSKSDTGDRRAAPIWAAGATLLALSFVSIFAVGIPTGGDPSLPVILSVWGVIGAATIAVFVRTLMQRVNRS